MTTARRRRTRLQTSGAYLQRFLETVFADLPEDLRSDGLYFYVDDMVLTSRTWEEHLRHVRAFFEACKKNKDLHQLQEGAASRERGLVLRHAVLAGGHLSLR